MVPRLLLALLISASPMTQWGPANRPNHWDGDHDRAMAAARREGRATVLYFTLPLDATSHEVFIRLKTEPRLVDAMDRMVRVVVEQPDLGIAYGRYRLAEFPAIAVLDPGGALVDTITITPHSEAWVHAFLGTLREAHARTASWTERCAQLTPPPPCPPKRVVPPRVIEVPAYTPPVPRKKK